MSRSTAALGLEITRLPRGTEFSRLRSRLIAEHTVDDALDVGAGVGDYGRDLRAHRS
jgi:hypothetical protein